MSVSDSFTVIQRPWQGYEDPGLPVGMWIAQGTILGDASGGTQSVIFIFKSEAEPLGGRFYNLEQIEAHSTRAVNIDSGLQIVNFDIVGPTGLVTREIHVPLFFDGITSAALQTGDLRLPVFLGRPQLVDLETQLLYRAANVDTETLFLTAQGYIWEPRSLLTDGGLRRPLDSLYG